jgi:hypothetical protein
VNRQVLNRPASPTFLRVGLGLGLVTAAITSTVQTNPALLSGLQDVGAAKALAVRNAVSVKEAGVAGAFGTVTTDGVSGADLQDVDGAVDPRQPGDQVGQTVPQQAGSAARSGFRHPLTASRTRPITQTSALVRAAKAQAHALESGALTLLPTTPTTDWPSTDSPSTNLPSDLPPTDLAPASDLATPTTPATPDTLAPPEALTTPAPTLPTAQPTTQSAPAQSAIKPAAPATSPATATTPSTPSTKSATSVAIAPPAIATSTPAEDLATPIYQATAAALSTQYQHPDDRGEGSTPRRAPRHRLATTAAH